MNEINLNNIKVGDKFVGQAKLCEALGIEPKKSGNSKKAQEKLLRTYINYTKTGKIIEITEIYSSPKEKEDGRKNGNNSIYRDNFLMIMSKMLLGTIKEEDLFFISRGRLSQELGLVNSNYRTGKFHIEGMSKKYNIPIENVIDFYNITDGKIRYNINSALEEFSSREYFTIIKDIAVCTIYGKHRLATEEEKELIEECIQKTLDLMKLKTLEEVRYKNKTNTFIENVIEEVNKKNGNIRYYYPVYVFDCINILKLQEVYKEMKSDKLTPTKLKADINENFRDSAINSATKRQERIYKDNLRNDVNRCTKNRRTLILSDSFCLHNESLVKKLIPIKARKIDFEEMSENIKEYSKNKKDEIIDIVEF